jgi:hypothetical protein
MVEQHARLLVRPVDEQWRHDRDLLNLPGFEVQRVHV